MSMLRNPFILRDAERIRYDETFLNLFGPGILDAISADILTRNLVQPFTSSSGGGKTSLFRLFEPRSLLMLDEHKDQYEELYQRLKSLTAISDIGPNVLGIYLSFNQNYDLLEELDFTPGQKIRVFFSLLNSRIIIAGIRGLLNLFELTFPDDLPLLKFSDSKVSNIHPQIELPCDGKYLYSWATENEMSILQIIDSFIPEQESEIVGHDTLFSLSLLRPDSVYINDNLVAKNILLLLDDVEKLSSYQRRKLKKILNEIRPPITIWTAERMEVLPSEELFAQGARLHREYREPINLENFWRGSLVKKKRFEDWLKEIADRRTKLAPDARRMQFNSFEACLTHSRDRKTLEKNYGQALEAVYKRVKKRVGKDKSFDLWLKKVEETRGSNKKKAIAWHALEILIERKYQRKLFGDPIPDEEMNIDSITSIAEFLLSQEFDIPYYYGFPRLVQTSSFNVEQFIHLAGDLFEEAISSTWLNNRYTLLAKRQEEILKTAAKRLWMSIPNNASNSSEVMLLIKHIKDICKEQTFRKKSPYGGVTGIGIRETEIRRLLNIAREAPKTSYAHLEQVLKTCISQNLLEERTDYGQGKKGQKWTILYLNRILCVNFGLPLNYGGWRPMRTSALLSVLRNQSIKEQSFFKGKVND